MKRFFQLTWPVILLLGACSPLWPWLIARWGPPGNEHISGILFAIILVGYFLIILWQVRKDEHQVISDRWLIWAVSWIALYGVSFNRVPGLITAMIAATALFFAIQSTLDATMRSKTWGLWPLLITALPLGPSAQFYGSYPLRVVAGHLASIMLGFRMKAAGASLTDGVNTVFVDAPCSGIRMLTTAIILASLSALIYRMSVVRTGLILLSAVLLAVFGNALRASTLCIADWDSGVDPDFERIIGLVVFSICVVILIWIAGLLKTSVALKSITSRCALSSRGVNRLFIAVSCVVWLNPMLTVSSAETAVRETIEVTWPTHWNGHSLIPMVLSVENGIYMDTFSGTMAQFQVQGTGQTILFRLTDRASRQVHPSEDCYRGFGYTVTPRQAKTDRHNHLWSRFFYESGDQRRGEVSQCVISLPELPAETELNKWIAHRESWPDLSSWYWAAAAPNSDVVYSLAITVDRAFR